MGNCVGGGINPEDREAKSRSSAIDRQLREDRKEYENTIKILLLGAGESGKSTVVKQMKIIHGDGYSTKELQDMIPVIFSNLAVSMKVVVQNMSKLAIEFADPSNEENSQLISNITTGLPQSSLPPEIIQAFRSLWADKGVRDCFSRAYEYQLNDSAP